MTTSSSEGNRCTRISPSAVLDDRLDGKDLEWARDHLRRCEACRDRVEDFREMLLRVGRLPSAAVGAAAMDQAFAAAIPDRLRGEAGSRSFEIAPPLTTAPTPLLAELPTPMRPEVTSVPDLLIELEREIFRDEPGQDHPTSLPPISEPIYPTMTAAPVEEIEAVPPTGDVEAPEELAAPPPLIPATPEPVSGSWREVHVDSHREPEPAVRDYEPEAGPPGEPMPAPTGGNVVFEQASVDAMRVPDESLDFAYSLGVLHHVPDAARAVSDVAAKLKPGAPFLVYLYYAFDNRPFWYRWLWRVADAARRAIARLPHGTRYVVTQVIAAVCYWPLARLARGLERTHALPANWPLAYYRDKSFYVMRNDARDRFGTALEHRFTRRQIKAMLANAGFTEITFSDRPPYWCASGVKRNRASR